MKREKTLNADKKRKTVVNSQEKESTAPSIILKEGKKI